MAKPKQPKGNTVWTIALLTVLGLAGGAYAYVFIAGAPQLDAPTPEKATGLSFEVQSFESEAMGTTRKYGVILPPGYQDHPNIRYPVIFILHGGHGDERDLEKKAALTSVLHDLYAEKRLAPSIVITPDGNDRRGSSPLWDPNYYDGPRGNVATLIGQDIPREVVARYRTRPEPQFWAIGGISSGGWGAVNIGLKYHQQFNTLFSHTGYFVDQSGAQNSPQITIQKMAPQVLKSLRIYLDAGQADHRYLKATASFSQVLERLNVNHVFYVFPGGHGIMGPNVGWNYWHKHLFDSLSYVGKQFKVTLSQVATPKLAEKSTKLSK